VPPEHTPVVPAAPLERAPVVPAAPPASDSAVAAPAAERSTTRSTRVIRAGEWPTSADERPQPTPPAAEAPSGQVVPFWETQPALTQQDAPEIECWSCGTSIYPAARFCYKCRIPVHSCNNCRHRNETACKSAQKLTSQERQITSNQCPWWRPSRL
jgi:hypothetical protein